MKSAALTDLRKVEIIDVPKPSIRGDKDVLLKIAVVGVCGSDIHYYTTGKIGSQVVQYPFIVGHECSATVEAVGKKVKKVKPGDQVVVEPAVSCHTCPQCKMGRENTCFNLKFLGTPGQIPGCLCEYIVMPEENCLPTKGGITLEEAALCEPFAIGVYTIKQANLSKGDKIAILGSGPIGLSCMLAAKIQGVSKIYMTDKLDYRVDFTKRHGATWAGNPDRQNIVEDILRLEPNGVDIACECAGRQETVDEAIDLLRPGGKLMLVGIPRFERFSFPADKIRRKEITIINVRRQNRCTQTAIDLVASGKAKIDFLITHRFKLDETKSAFDLVADYRDGVIKAMVQF
ncbi:MAG: alcohol dehydrogenase catalytic domain-containing protein [Sedimentisphaerales bacterium]|nr:alcohol dehydrogenase catalytic domain-containing protein [Sedimentisphaerales bacterium]